MQNSSIFGSVNTTLKIHLNDNQNINALHHKLYCAVKLHILNSMFKARHSRVSINFYLVDSLNFGGTSFLPQHLSYNVNVKKQKQSKLSLYKVYFMKL